MKRAERDLEVGGVGLKVVESSRDAGLQLGGALARRARGRDLVEGAHGCDGCRWRIGNGGAKFKRGYSSVWAGERR